MRLRRALICSAAGMGTLTLTASVALVLLTTLMRRNVEEIDRVQNAAKLSSDLARNGAVFLSASTPLERALVEARGRVMLTRLGAAVRDQEERTLYQQLIPGLERWWQAPESGRRPTGELAFLLMRLEDLFAARAATERDHAQRLDMLANALGVTSALLLVAGVTFFLWLLHVAVFRPVEAVAASVARFAGGDLAARAPEVGAHEVRRIAAMHNAMADALARTREDQLRYVATVVHDLRNPLAAVQLAVGYVTPGRPIPSEQRMREIFALIGRQLKRLNSIVGDVLNAVQVDGGQILLRRQPCDVGDLARTCLALFQSMCPTYHLELERHGHTTLHADSVRIEQVLNNLVGNAVKYSPPGTRVQVEVEGDDDQIAVTVADDGPGIPPAIAGDIFRPFVRGPSEHEEVAGAGLGLYVSKRIVEAHGGTLDLVPTAEPGATFRFTLPRRAAEEDKDADRPAHPAPLVGAEPLPPG